MNRIVFFTLALLFAFSCQKKEEAGSEYYNPDGSPVTWEQARNLTEKYWSMFDYVVISKDILPPSTRIIQKYTDQLSEPYYSPSYDSWVVVMAPDPSLINGLQIYHYVYVNVKTGEIYVDPDVREIDKESITWRSIKVPSSQYNTSLLSYSVRSKAETITKSSRSAKKWAIIINGGGSIIDNHSRYWNNCSAMFRILVNDYSYQKNHIYLLVSDGTSPAIDMDMGRNGEGPYQSSPLDYDGDGQAEQNIYPSSKGSLQSVFTALGQIVDSDDDVFVFITDHGVTHNNTSYITLWNGGILSPQEFDAELNKIHNDNGRINIVMGQCFSGGFVNSITRMNVSITTASSANEYSYGMLDRNYDNFVYNWMSAMKGNKIDDGQAVNADMDSSLGISFFEAFQYAKDRNYPEEHSQYRSVPDSTGIICTLGHDQIARPVIVGPYNVSSRHSTTFSIQNMPIGGTANWNFGPGLSGSTTSVPTNVRYSGQKIIDYSSLSAYVTVDDWMFLLPGVYLNCWGAGSYEASSCLNGSSGVYQISLPSGAYGFTWGCDSNWQPLYQGHSYVDFETKGDEPSMVWCDFYTPFGDRCHAYIYE